MPNFQRRTFCTATVAAAASSVTSRVAADTTSAPSSKGSRKVRLGIIGCGNRAKSHLADFGGRDDCKVSAVCDVEKRRTELAQQQIKNLTDSMPAAFEDMRDLFADKSIDTVIIATPDHWHCLAAIWACQAGKDVYVEKPVGNSPWEAQQLVNAAQKYDRIVQVGTQNRSGACNLSAKAYVESGQLGDVSLVRVYNQLSVPPVKLRPAKPVPVGLNWNLWLGPAPLTDYHPDRHYRWREFWEYGGGDVTDDTIHQLDLACMLMDVKRLPRSVHSTGYRQNGSEAEVAGTIATTFEFDNWLMLYNQTQDTNYMMKSDPGVRNGDLFPYWPQNGTRIEIFGSKAMMMVGRHGGGWQVFARTKGRKPVVIAEEFGRFPDQEHKSDFIDAIRNRRPPNGGILAGHMSTSMCHFANISFRTGNQHLLIDQDSQRFRNHDGANELLRPPCRTGFEVPEIF